MKPLTRDQARSIYFDDRPYAVIAEAFGIAYSTVTAIKYGRTYRAETGGKRRLKRVYNRIEEEEVVFIFTSPKPAKEVAWQLQLPIDTIHAIRSRRMRRTLTEGLKLGIKPD